MPSPWTMGASKGTRLPTLASGRHSIGILAALAFAFGIVVSGTATAQVVAQGDLLLSREQLARAPAHLQARTWPGGRVPVVFDTSIAPVQQARFYHACRQWSAQAAVACVPYAGERDWVRVTKDGSGCRSTLGASMFGGEARLNLDDRCWGGDSDVPVSYQTLVHEIGHLLGLWHEQQRADRDEFIEVHDGNVLPSHVHDFDKLEHASAYGTPYDLSSVMHYQPYQVSTGSGPAFDVREPYRDRQVGNVTVSPIDGEKLRGLYGGQPSRGLPGVPSLQLVSPPGQNPVTMAWAPSEGAPPSEYVVLVGTRPDSVDVAVLPMGAQTTLTATAPRGYPLYVRVGARTPAGDAWSAAVAVFVP